ncbi:hypothetical protein CIB48_g1012 [Xylaria polymorpha]|nr:hypothetical protein CIB48_g1012 [Xylaria polymorpha]
MANAICSTYNFVNSTAPLVTSVPSSSSSSPLHDNDGGLSILAKTTGGELIVGLSIGALLGYILFKITYGLAKRYLQRRRRYQRVWLELRAELELWLRIHLRPRAEAGTVIEV